LIPISNYSENCHDKGEKEEGSIWAEGWGSQLLGKVLEAQTWKHRADAERLKPSFAGGKVKASAGLEAEGGGSERLSRILLGKGIILRPGSGGNGRVPVKAELDTGHLPRTYRSRKFKGMRGG